MNGWHVTVGANSKAHHLTNGVTACADRINPACFTRAWQASTERDHVCVLCAEKFPRTCECWSCQMRRAGALRPRTGNR